MLILSAEQKKNVRDSIISHAVLDSYEQALLEDGQQAQEDAVLEQAENTKMLQLINQHGLTKSLYAIIDPQAILVQRISGGTQMEFDPTDADMVGKLTHLVISTLERSTEAGMSQEGVREVLHNDKFRTYSGMILSMFYNPKTKAQKAAGAAAQAAGLGKKGVEDAMRKAGPSFLRGMFRAMVIGTIADIVIESGIKLADKIVNAGRVYGNAPEVQANIKAIQAILAKLKQAADLKIALDGSNSDQIIKQAQAILAEIHTIYNNAPAYKMTLGKDTGWTMSLLQSSGKAFDATVKGTDAVSESIVNAAKGELTVMTDDKGTPNPGMMDALKERGRTIKKGLNLANKLVKSTTRVFTELTKHIETKGASTVVKKDGEAASTPEQKS